MAVTRWRPALNAFTITFADRMPAGGDREKRNRHLRRLSNAPIGALSGTSSRCNVDDAAEVPHETVTDPVLERSQRLFEETFAPSLGPRIGPGPGTDETLLRPRAEAPLDR
jgi:hypothetical protein